MIDQPLEASNVCRRLAGILSIERRIRHCGIPRCIIGKVAMDIELGPGLIQIPLETRYLIVESEDALL